MGVIDLGTDRTGAETLHDAFGEHYTALVRMADLILAGQGDAEDLVQEAFARAARTIPTLDVAAVRPYLRRTILNLSRNRFRRAVVERRHPGGVDPPKPPMDLEDREVVWSAVKNLSPRQRACVVLRYYEELTELEKSRVLGCSAGTVKSQTHRALEHLRKELGDGP